MIDDLVEDARRLAVALQSDPPCQRQKRCLIDEEARPLDLAEKSLGWTRRPFDGYSRRRLCDACAAYWHVSVAELLLRNIVRAAEARKADGVIEFADRKKA